LFVAQAVGNFYRAHIGKGHTRVFRLSTGEAAEHVGIAVNSRGRMAEELLRHPSVGVGILTKRKKPSLTKKALPTRDRERSDYPIACLQIVNFAPDLDDFAHKFVAENIALFHGGHEAVVKVQI